VCDVRYQLRAAAVFANKKALRIPRAGRGGAAAAISMMDASWQLTA
jgi:hypothetical protein